MKQIGFSMETRRVEIMLLALPFLAAVLIMLPRLLSPQFGFSLFCTWFYVLWRGGKYLERQASREFRLFGWTALFVIVAFLAEGFSTDSFALPYLWVSLGVVTAASAIARQETKA